MKRHLVFDLDGTLVESLPGIAEGVNRALRALGRPVRTQDEIRTMIGTGAANLCAKAIGYENAETAPEKELEAMHSLFRREYPRCWQGSYTRPFPGIDRLLNRLAAEGAHLAVLSNKPHEVTVPLVQSVFPTVPFSPILGFSGKYPRKPAPDALEAIAKQWGIFPQELTLIGDSLHDAHTAANAGCNLALVAWGYAKTEDLLAYPAPVFDDVEKLGRHLLSD